MSQLHSSKFGGRVALRKVADSLFTSKIGYGLQLIGNISGADQDPTLQDIEAIQLIQNKLVRFLNGTKISDKINTRTLLKNVDMISVNQLNAQIKITEALKANNVPKHPIKFKRIDGENINVTTKAITNGNLLESGKTNLVKNTFLSDARKAWNISPEVVKNCKSIWTAKKEIKEFVLTIPV